ncbi:MAG TPA: flagellar basal body rod C-terminal domain-containing protein [Planctomycetota bacterium]|nr:flagellar basal body rod C-terminal domain-containing protein [Planctomycetota bacterium]
MDAGAIETSARGMRAQRARMEVVAANLAHADTTSAAREERTAPDGARWTRHVPFRRQVALIEPGLTVRVVDDPSPFRVEHEPDHPHAVPSSSGEPDAGTLYRPNVHPMAEMVEMMSAARAYEANVAAMETAKAMAATVLRILA